MIIFYKINVKSSKDVKRKKPDNFHIRMTENILEKSIPIFPIGGLNIYRSKTQILKSTYLWEKCWYCNNDNFHK
jgi:hypothetical protein